MIVAKFLLRSHSLPIHNKLIVEPFKKYATCIMTFFIPLTFIILCQFYSITSPALFTKHNKVLNEKKEDFFAYMAATAYHVISKKSKIASLDTIAFLDTHVRINNPY